MTSAVDVIFKEADLGAAMPGAAVRSFSSISEHALDVSGSQSQTACSFSFEGARATSLDKAPASSDRVTTHPQKASRFITRPVLRAKALSLEPAASTPRRNEKMQSLGATCSFENASVSRQNSIQCSRPMRPASLEPPDCTSSLVKCSSMAARPVSRLVVTRDANNLGMEGAISHRGRRFCTFPLTRELNNGSRGRGRFVVVSAPCKECRMRPDCVVSLLRRCIWLEWLC